MSSIEACWTVRVGDPRQRFEDLNGGVAVLESNRIFGGDGGFAYLGTYEVNGQELTAELQIIRHDPQVESMYGDALDTYSIILAARRVGDNLIQGVARRHGFPDAQVIMRRLAELP